mmetsp:Transcript_21631/g.34643  ORF Transcript_21631/g.34643 Transcript_21631/m.34643 type:complete len:91 (+) Transcript_21631:2447-2719(+)
MYQYLRRRGLEAQYGRGDVKDFVLTSKLWTCIDKLWTSETNYGYQKELWMCMDKLPMKMIKIMDGIDIDRVTKSHELYVHLMRVMKYMHI